MFSSSNGRIILLRNPFEYILKASKLFFVSVGMLGLAFVAFYSKLKEQAHEYNNSNFIVTSVVILFSIISTLIANFIGGLRFLDRVISSIRRKILLMALRVHRKGKLACLYNLFNYIINIPLLRLHARYDEQGDFITKILNYLSDSNARGGRFLIEGESGTGKTTAITILIEKISINKNLFHLIDNIFYFDFAQDWTDQARVLERFEEGGFTNGIVILDNFHRLKRSLLRQYSLLFLNPGAAKDICTIFLTHDAKNLSIKSNLQISLVSDIDKYDRIFRFKGINYSKALASLPNDSRRNLRERTPCNFIQDIHLLSLSDNKKTFDLFCDLVSSSNMDTNFKDDDLLKQKLIAFLVALSIYKGGFSHSEWKRAIQYARQKKVITRKESFLIKSRLKQLVKIGVVFKVSTNIIFYIFHHELAKSLQNSYRGHYAFDECFEALIFYLAKISFIKKAYLELWLYGIESGKVDLFGWPMFRLFTHALTLGQYRFMLDSLTRVVGELDNEGIHRLELAVINELTGDYKKSRSNFKKLLDANPTEQEYLEIKLRQIEYEHTENVDEWNNWLTGLLNHPNELISLTAKFWLIHIKIHHGDYNYEALKGLTDTLTTKYWTIGKENPYARSHLLRRAYFDLYRILYLSGSGSFEIFNELKQHSANKLIAQEHPLYEAYITKTAEANFLHYELIFEKALVWKYNGNPRFKQSEADDLNGMISEATKSYQKSIREFEYLGDKASNSMKLRLAELKLMNENENLEELQLEIRGYLAYANKSSINDFIGNSFMILAKAVYLESVLLLNRSAAIYSKEMHTQAVAEVDSCTEQAQNYLQKAIQAYKDGANNHGRIRGELLYDLLISQKQSEITTFSKKWFDRGQELKNDSYERESTLLELIMQNGLSPILLADIFRYYPIVIQ